MELEKLAYKLYCDDTPEKINRANQYFFNAIYKYDKNEKVSKYFEKAKIILRKQKLNKLINEIRKTSI